MKKSSFVALILGTIGGVFFALGMCMALVPELGTIKLGVISGLIGLAVLLLTAAIWRRMEGKAPIKISGRTILTTIVAVLGALLLGVGLCLVMLLNKLVMGIIVGVVGILVLFMLIPLVKGLK